MLSRQALARIPVILMAAACAVTALPQGCASKEDISGKPDPSPVDGPTVESIVLDKLRITLELEGSVTLTATVKPQEPPVTVVWTSLNPDIATVSEGNVTGRAVGETRITAKAGGRTAVCLVSVVNTIIPIEQITISTKEVTLEELDTYKLDWSVTPASEAHRVVWTSDNEGIRVVGGTVYADRPGEATITASGDGKSASCHVTVTEVPGGQAKYSEDDYGKF